jgi:nucleoside-diphosphate-sugar epimerase
MKHALVTGGAGFFGSLLKKHLLSIGWKVVSIDLQKDEDTQEHFTAIQGDIRNRELMRKLFSENRFDAVFHCAAILAHAVKDKDFLWSCNVDGTQSVVDHCKEFGVRKIVFTSTNCLWGEPIGKPVTEEEQPKPIEIYGKSKWEAEKILLSDTEKLDVVIFRCPTIIDAGRLGLLAILFEFIDEGRKVWVVGGGDNKYQFIYAQDLIAACLKAVDYKGSGIFNIGSDDVKSFKEVYDHVITQAGTGARVASLPRGPTIFAMKIAYALGLSPLGPYQYKMIAESFEFDTSKIKRELHWNPTLKNEDMLYKSYQFYRENRSKLKTGDDVPAHRQPAKMGVIRLLKWLS